MTFWDGFFLPILSLLCFSVKIILSLTLWKSPNLEYFIVIEIQINFSLYWIPNLNFWTDAEKFLSSIQELLKSFQLSLFSRSLKYKVIIKMSSLKINSLLRTLQPCKKVKSSRWLEIHTVFQSASTPQKQNKIVLIRIWHSMQHTLI